MVALTVAEAVDRLIAAINGRELGELDAMLREDPAEDTARRGRFLELIKEYGPRATLGSIDQAIVGEDRARAGFTVALDWRGAFGVSHRRIGRFVGIVRHGDTGWRFEGSILLDAIP
jgi:hypothetical protein